MALPRRFLFMLTLAGGLLAQLNAEPVVWPVDPRRSTLEVAARSTFGIFLCRISHFEARISLERESLRIVSADVTFALADVKTGREPRDAQLLEWAESDRFGEVSFHLLELTPTAAGSWLARGTVTWHGVEKGVTFPVRSLVQGRLNSLDGETTVDYRDFGLPVLRRFYLTSINPLLLIKFHLQGWLDGGEAESTSPGGKWFTPPDEVSQVVPAR